MCQTVLPNVYILVHSWTADQKFKCSLFLISCYYSPCMLCPNPVTPRGHQSQQCFHFTGSKVTQVLSTYNSRVHNQWCPPTFLSLLFARLHEEQYKHLIVKESTFPKCLKAGKVAEMCQWTLTHPLAIHSLLTATAATRFSCPVKSQICHLPHLSPKILVLDFSLR